MGVLLLLVVVSAQAGGAQQDATRKVEIKLGHMMTPASPEGKAYQYFADQVQERSGGRIEVKVYPAEQLGDSKTQIDSTVLGSQDIVTTGASLFARFDNIFNVATVPFLFKDNSYFSTMMQGEIGQMQKDALEKNGLVLLNDARNMMRGPYRVLVSNRPIRSLSDVQGLRFRTYENEIYMRTWQTLGANPIVIPWGETYMALMQKTVNAAVSPMVQLYDMKFTEVAPYVTIINEYTSDVVWAINKQKFDSLSPEYRRILRESANASGEYLASIEKETIDANIQRMKTEHKAEFIEIDTDAFRSFLKDFYYKLEADGKIVKGIVDAALK
jgi:tripartite ATP-independent transporter DctP family solute receptor